MVVGRISGVDGREMLVLRLDLSFVMQRQPGKARPGSPHWSQWKLALGFQLPICLTRYVYLEGLAKHFLLQS
jgi:hypothetical protein